ncbi:MAG: crotonase/enoyl-CoA hydratase family protein [Pseudomonadota bacterium]
MTAADPTAKTAAGKPAPQRHAQDATGETVLVSRRDGVQTIRIARSEKKNALTDAMYHALADALVAAEADESIGTHLFASHAGVFTAGNDIADFISRATSPVGDPTSGVVRFLEAQCTTQKPMVAAVDGLAIGIGTTMLWQCDMVLASPKARFHTPFIDLGLVPENASSLLAPRLMGHALAFEMLCLGEPFDADRALSAGFVNAIHPAEALDAEAQALAARLALKPRAAMRISRALVRGTPDERLAALRREGKHFAERLASDEARAAFTAFMNRKTG